MYDRDKIVRDNVVTTLNEKIVTFVGAKE